jgi:hypothetical protein
MGMASGVVAGPRAEASTPVCVARILSPVRVLCEVGGELLRELILRVAHGRDAEVVVRVVVCVGRLKTLALRGVRQREAWI